MSGYAASARIVRASPHVMRHAGRERTPDRPAAGTIVDVVERSPAGAEPSRLAERWARARDRWAQLTFYVTDPDSWR